MDCSQASVYGTIDIEMTTDLPALAPQVAKVFDVVFREAELEGLYIYDYCGNGLELWLIGDDTSADLSFLQNKEDFEDQSLLHPIFDEMTKFYEHRIVKKKNAAGQIDISDFLLEYFRRNSDLQVSIVIRSLTDEERKEIETLRQDFLASSTEVKRVLAEREAQKKKEENSSSWIREKFLSLFNQ